MLNIYNTELILSRRRDWPALYVQNADVSEAETRLKDAAG